MAKVIVARDLQELTQRAAAFLLEWRQAAIATRDVCAIALSGGSTPRGLYALLAQPPLSQQVAWDRIHVFWGDERCVPPDHPESNYRMAMETLISNVPLPHQNIHRPPVELNDPHVIAAAYEAELRRYFDLGPTDLPIFDLVLLGLGTDGHTASLFPHSPALDETARLVAPVYVPELQSHRITLTLPVLNRARAVVFLVAGADKRASLQKVLAGETRLPAARVHPMEGAVYWFVDRNAMGKAASETA